MALNIKASDIPHAIDVDFGKKARLPTVCLKQYDENSSYIVAKPWKNGEEYTIPSGYKLAFCATKPSGLGIYDTENCEIKNNKLYFKVQYQATVECGEYLAEFRLINKNGDVVESLSHSKFRVSVEPSALSNETIISSSELNILRQLIEDAKKTLADLTALHDAFSVYEQYINSKPYVVGNKVAHGGSSYLCILPTKGISPPNTNYWLLIAAKGDKGDSAVL